MNTPSLCRTCVIYLRSCATVETATWRLQVWPIINLSIYMINIIYDTLQLYVQYVITILFLYRHNLLTEFLFQLFMH